MTMILMIIMMIYDDGPNHNSHRFISILLKRNMNTKMKTIFPCVDQTKTSSHLKNHNHIYDIPCFWRSDQRSEEKMMMLKRIKDNAKDDLGWNFTCLQTWSQGTGLPAWKLHSCIKTPWSGSQKWERKNLLNFWRWVRACCWHICLLIDFAFVAFLVSCLDDFLGPFLKLMINESKVIGSSS